MSLNLVPHVCSRGLVFHIWPKIWIPPYWYSWGLLEVPWVFMEQSWSPEILWFRVLPFGLASACYVFTKLLRPLVKHWRARGIRAIVYIDDGIITSSSKSQSIEHRDLVLGDLNWAGFVFNVPKCCLEPNQVGKWLGFITDLVESKFQVPEEKTD